MCLGFLFVFPHCEFSLPQIATMTLQVNLSSGSVYGNIPGEEDGLFIPSAEAILVVLLFSIDRVPPDQRKHDKREKTKLAQERNGGKRAGYT